MGKLSDEHKQRLLKRSRKTEPVPSGTRLETVEEFLAKGGTITIGPQTPDIVGGDHVLPALSYRKSL